MDDASSFGGWVRSRRKALGFTQKELAHQIGCSLSVIQKIEIDQRRPSREFAELLAHHLEIDAGQHDAFVRLARIPLHEPPLPGGAAHPAQRFDNLPAPLTALVGREWEVEALCATLLRDSVRLLTISGPPGIGKTRLALAAAQALLDDFAGGVCFVALAPIARASYILPAIARALGVSQLNHRPLIEILKSYLSDQHLLLVLDNFEHVLPAAAEVAELLEGAPRLKALVTSRSLLQLYGEHEFVAPALALPDLKRLPTPAELARYAAVALFVQRARAARLDFVLSAENAASVAELCVHLDGLPLAIELAAARSKHLSPGTLLARLTSLQEEGAAHLAVLAAKARNLPPRQQTLYAAIDWSYNLLSPVEQRIFRSLGVFAGGCSLPALRAVNGLSSTETWLHHVMDSLVNQNLVVLQLEPDGEPRFTLLEMIREYALQQLEAHGESDRLRLAHADFFLEMGELVDGVGMSPEAKAWAAIARDHDNLRLALHWALQHDGARGLLLAAALAEFWDNHGLLMESSYWLTQLLAQVEPEQSRRYAHAARRLGVCLFLQGDYLVAQEWLAKSIACWRSLGDEHELGIVLHYLAAALVFCDEYAAALASAQEAVTLLRMGADRDWLATALNILGATHTYLAEYAAASSILEECLAIFAALNNEWGIALSWLALADLSYAARDFGAAHDLLQKALQIYRRLNDRWFMAQTLWELGKVLWHQGRAERALACWRESTTLGREIGAKEYVAGSLLHIGFAALEMEDAAEAHICFGESLAVYRQMEHNAGIGYAVCGLAGAGLLNAGVQTASLTQAAEALGLAASLLATRRKLLDELERSHYEELLAFVRGRLDPALFAAAWAEGQALTAELWLQHNPGVSL